MPFKLDEPTSNLRIGQTTITLCCMENLNNATRPLHFSTRLRYSSFDFEMLSK